eukprot:SAG11_NODE_1641_length_4530_cov_6.481607_4_plen_109_part_00
MAASEAALQCSTLWSGVGALGSPGTLLARFIAERACFSSVTSASAANTQLYGPPCLKPSNACTCCHSHAAFGVPSAKYALVAAFATPRFAGVSTQNHAREVQLCAMCT